MRRPTGQLPAIESFEETIAFDLVAHSVLELLHRRHLGKKGVFESLTVCRPAAYGLTEFTIRPTIDQAVDEPLRRRSVWQARCLLVRCVDITTEYLVRVAPIVDLVEVSG